MEVQAEQLLEFINVGGVVRAITILGATWLVGRMLRELTVRAARTFTAQRLLVEQVSAFLRFGLYVLGTLLALRFMFALSKEVLTVMGGTIVVTVGLVLKDQASSILAGIMILIEKPFQVGDRVTFGGFYGEIKSIGLRSARLVTLDDNEITIPNNKFLTDPVSSGNSGALTMLVQQDFHIGADQNFDRAAKIVHEALTTSRYFLADRPAEVLVNQVQLDMVTAVRIRAKAYVIELRYETAFATDVSRRVLRAFQEENILPPALHFRPVTARPLEETALFASRAPAEV